MTNRDETQGIGKAVATGVATAAVAGATALADGKSPEQAAILAGASVLPSILGEVFSAGLDRKRRQAKRFWEELLREIAADEGVTREEVEERIQSLSDEPYVREAIFRSLRALMDFVDDDDAVTVPLARLVAESYRQKARPDAFFRGTARLLTELSAAEVNELRRTLAWAFEGTEAGALRLVVMEHSWGPDRSPVPAPPHFLRFIKPTGGLAEHHGRLDGIEDPARLLHLLEAHGLAQHSDDAGYFDVDPFRIRLERGVAERLQRILSG